MSSFEREDRYLVLKRTDVEDGLAAHEKDELNRLVGFINARRVSYHLKHPLRAVVVEHDWPEYELVWKLIEMRMVGIDVASSVLSVLRELERALSKFPQWPNDPIHAAAVLQEEAGELVQGALQATYEPHKSDPADVEVEAVQTGAMAIRWLMSFDHYQWQSSQQHDQVAK